MYACLTTKWGVGECRCFCNMVWVWVGHIGGFGGHLIVHLCIFIFMDDGVTSVSSWEYSKIGCTIIPVNTNNLHCQLHCSVPSESMTVLISSSLDKVLICNLI